MHILEQETRSLSVSTLQLNSQTGRDAGGGSSIYHGFGGPSRSGIVRIIRVESLDGFYDAVHVTGHVLVLLEVKKLGLHVSQCEIRPWTEDVSKCDMEELHLIG